MIIEFFKKLFGGKVDQAVNAAVPSQQELLNKHVKGLEHVQGAEHIRISTGKTVRECVGAQLFEDEDDGDLLWRSTWNTEIHPSQWVDEWGPVQPQDFDTFWHHKTEFDMLHASDANEAEQRLQSFGYRDVGHHFQVEKTFLKYFGHPHSPGDTNLDDLMWDQERVSKAAMAGAMRYQQGLQQQAMAANPELLAPVEGVDVDTYAKIAAASATGLGQEELVTLLGNNGMDLAKWQRVNAAWTEKMSKDTSGAIAMAYSKAFGGAGAGQYGAAGQAGAAVLGGQSVQAAAGAEPMSFDRYCEVQGAMTAWSNTGQDVNAMLKHTFNMTALDWSTASMWWMSHMQSDLSYFDRHSKLCEKYEKQYSAGAPAGADDDLTF
jgi:hypothetical protein